MVSFGAVISPENPGFSIVSGYSRYPVSTPVIYITEDNHV
ncbi:hypothetical protein MC7420_1173 [Coleofasciculus chthonoplastes PCC 7420]|uniref:Uncharacterized protein n=1 Tax=Coleofasciculus chthonoplastes PCC 7420 TaxID=118168 RepID=B4VXG4_9CYAN|nr:hypothetical protein MC7420_1173 [Coleofasciculus chthonoplastes PCC 7420]